MYCPAEATEQRLVRGHAPLALSYNKMTFHMFYRKHRIGHLFACLFLLCLILSLSACGKSEKERNQIRFAVQDRMISALPLLALGKGYFKDQGLDIAASHFSNGPACAEALVNGEVDIATMGDVTTIITLAAHPHLKVIASHGTGERRHRLMVRMTSPYHSLADLKGKKIGVKRGTSSHGALLNALEKAGLSTDDVELVDLPPTIKGMIEPLLIGRVEAFVASEPTPSQSETLGARELLILTDEDNNYPIFLVADNDFLATRPHDVVLFLKALSQAEEFIRQNRKSAIHFLSDAIILDPTIIPHYLHWHKFDLRLDDKIITSLERTAAFLQNEQLINTIPDFTKTTTTEYLDRMKEMAPAAPPEPAGSSGLPATLGDRK